MIRCCYRKRRREKRWNEPF